MRRERVGEGGGGGSMRVPVLQLEVQHRLGELSE